MVPKRITELYCIIDRNIREIIPSHGKNSLGPKLQAEKLKISHVPPLPCDLFQFI